GSGQMLIRFPPGYGDTVNKAMAILSFICSQRE
ncbi:endonuclease, partial [Escherichia coli]